jgi:hypothetical protein
VSPTLLSLALILLGAPAPAVPKVVDPPVQGRPENFSWVVGSYDDLIASATPTELSVADPLVLKVTVTGSGPPRYHPKRELLKLFPADFDKDFFVKPLPERDRALPEEKTWEFFYELRPKHEGVQKVPLLQLAYYPGYGARYQTLIAPAIPLTVKPQAQVAPPTDVQTLQSADGFYALATGPQVLRRAGTGQVPMPVLAAALLAPLFACGIWFVFWRRRSRRAARAARRRRSQAAERTLRGLRGLGPADGSKVSELLASYLRQRLDLPAAEPTPREAAGHLRRLGVSAALARQATDLLYACDLARFAPTPSAEAEDLAGGAERLILALEAEPCPSEFA